MTDKHPCDTALMPQRNAPYTQTQASQPAVTLPAMPAPIVFAHANSYPASTYRVLFDIWRAAGHEVHALERFGHDPRYPVTMNWPHLVEQLRDFIEDEVREPAWLVGHSLGGYLSMMVASQHPHLALGVVVLDSPILTGWKSAGLGAAKRLQAMDRVMPSRISAQRTHEWPSLEAAHAHFRAKPAFAAFHPEVLADYVAHGTRPQGPVRRLSFDREIESAIYNTVPHRLLQSFRRRPFRCPVAFIGGTRSRELRQVGLGGIRQIVGSRLSWIQGSHLYPFESPDQTAQVVLDWLHQFQSPPAHATPADAPLARP